MMHVHHLLHTNFLVGSIHDYTKQPKFGAVLLAILKFSDSLAFLYETTGKVKIHKHSKTSADLFLFQRLAKPRRWQIIFPSFQRL